MDTTSLLQELNLSSYIALDLETTGLDPYSSNITEISALKFVDGEPTDEFTSLVDPEQFIPEEIVELTGIDNSMVKGKPKIGELLPSLIDFIGNTPIVGQNIGFDLSFLNYNCRKNGQSFPQVVVYDTLPLSKTFLFFKHKFNLTSISEHYGLNTESAHRASVDTFNTGTIFKSLIHEAASTPLTIIQQFCNVLNHVEVPNKKLFIDLLQLGLKLKSTEGITTSNERKNLRRHFFSNKTTLPKENLPETVSNWFNSSGEISQNWESFEARDSQVDLASDIYDSFQNEDILLAEAGTGLGKSLAYLSAGVLYSKKMDVPLVVSTYTKNLQEQLFEKDIPQLAKVLNINLHAVIYKGRYNYLCKTRLDHLISQAQNFIKDKECIELLPVILWSYYTQTGDISECRGYNPKIAPRVWDLVKSEYGYCTTKRCEPHDGCYLTGVRKSLRRSHIIIVNHYLLCSELMQENPSFPEEFNYIIDEGHNLVPAARDQLIMQVSSGTFNDVFNFFTRDYKPFKNVINDVFSEFPQLENFLIDVEQRGQSLKAEIKSFFESYTQSKNNQLYHSKYNEVKVRYIDSQSEFQHTFPLPGDILEKLKDYIQFVDNFVFEATKHKDDIDSYYFQELNVHVNRLQTIVSTFQLAIVNDSDSITWSSLYKNGQYSRTNINVGPKHVYQFLVEKLFSRSGGGVICSATLTVEYSFNYIKGQLGLGDIDFMKNVEEKIYHSPFHYEDQTLLFTWQGDADVNSYQYIEKVGAQIDELSKKLKKRMLVLCTSYNQTNQLGKYLKAKVNSDKRELFVQSIGKNRNSLLAGYLENEQSILVGTSSFWEGVDLPGDKIEILVILKIPFASPSDPIIQSQIEFYQEEGRNAFIEFQVPDAIVKMKQGFGRLIRSLNDSGICLITDPRVLKSRYGKMILESLPLESKPYEHASRIVYEAESFFGNS